MVNRIDCIRLRVAFIRITRKCNKRKQYEENQEWGNMVETCATKDTKWLVFYVIISYNPSIFQIFVISKGRFLNY